MLKLSSSGSRGRAGHHWSRGAWLSVFAVAGVLALGVPAASAAGEQTGGSAGERAAVSQPANSAAQTAFQYVIRFWPLWLSHYQQAAGLKAVGADQLVGVKTMGPTFRTVVAINDDTIYGTAYVDLRLGPAVLTIPPTKATWSLNVADDYGTIIPTTIKPQEPGVYLLVLPGWKGRVPAGMTKVTIPYPVTNLAIRPDKYSSTGVNMIAQATAFRKSLHLTTLAKYKADPASGPFEIKPIINFAFSFKVTEDIAVQLAPTLFLRSLQVAVHSPSTAPLYPSDLQLSHAFDQAFTAAERAARHGHPLPLLRINAAARSAFHALVKNWLTHVGSTKWVHFTNIGDWGTAYLDRAGANEYIQLGNVEKAAGYWFGYVDGAGQTLNGAKHNYQVTFPASEIPQAKRFWSVTAYTPRTVELVRNPANKYLVASYTPGLKKNPDGSITITMAPTRPAGVPMANWLPVPRRQFNVTLRVYGPTGNTANPTYVPPAITPVP